MVAVELTLPGADNGSVPAARHFVAEVLAAWGLLDREWAASLIVTELAANAVLHAGDGPFTVTVTGNGPGPLRIAVADRSPRAPRQLAHSAEAATGRGLQLVAGLAARWGVDRQPAGKVVWADLPPPAAGGDGHDADPEALLEAFADPFDAAPLEAARTSSASGPLARAA